MKQLLLLACAALITTGAVAQNFPVQIEPVEMIPYLTHKVVVPGSPLTYQILFIGNTDDVQTTETYGNAAGSTKAKQWHDFIGFTPAQDGETGLGWVSVNHEMIQANDMIGDGGGMTVFKVDRNPDGTLKVLDQTLEDGRSGKFFNVDFANTVGETGMNCGGIVSMADGRIWTAEEWFRGSNGSINDDDGGVRDTADFTIGESTPNGFPGFNGRTIKKYQNFNYMVEIDPRQAKAIRKQYNWGRQAFEGGTVLPDNKTVYLGEDGGSGESLFSKFVADEAGDFTKGTLYVYKQNPGEYTGTWVEVDNTNLDEMLTISAVAGQKGCTGFNRIEWVAYNKTDGKIYMTETGRDNPGGRIAGAMEKGFSIAQHYKDRADAQGVEITSDDYWDYYGRVMVFDPEDQSMRSYIEGGPYIDVDGEFQAYPDKHLSNPDGLTFLYVNGKTFMVINEDLNGSSMGRVPPGMTNRSCEAWLLDMDVEPTIDNLYRLAVTPQGAEITGACATPDGKTLLINSQHPSSWNEKPYNNSLTFAITGFDQLVTSVQDDNKGGDTPQGFSVFPNPVSQELKFSEPIDAALYNAQGARVRVIRGASYMDVRDLTSGSYYLMTDDGNVQNVIIQK